MSEFRHNISNTFCCCLLSCEPKVGSTQMYLPDGVTADLVTCSVLVLRHPNMI